MNTTTQAAIEAVRSDLQKLIENRSRKRPFFASIAAGLLLAFPLLGGFFKPHTIVETGICVVIPLLGFFLVWRYYTRDCIKPLREAISDVENEPQDAIAFTGRASTFTDWGHFEAAALDYQKALKLNPNDEVTIWLYGTLLRAFLDRDDEALPYFEKLTETAGDYQADAFSSCGKILAGSDSKRAEECFSEAIRIEPDEYDLFLDRAEFYLKYDRLKEAENDLLEAAKLLNILRVQEERLHALWGTYYQKWNDPEKALAELNRAVRLAPHCSEYLEQRAEVHDKLGYFPDAEADRKNAAEIRSRM